MTFDCTTYVIDVIILQKNMNAINVFQWLLCSSLHIITTSFVITLSITRIFSDKGYRCKMFSPLCEHDVLYIMMYLTHTSHNFYTDIFATSFLTINGWIFFGLQAVRESLYVFFFVCCNFHTYAYLHTFDAFVLCVVSLSTTWLPYIPKTYLHVASELTTTQNTQNSMGP